MSHAPSDTYLRLTKPATDAPARVQAVLKLTDGPDGVVECEMTTSDPTNVESPANLLAAFLGKYWDVLVTSCSQEIHSARAELAGKPIAPAPLRLLTHDGAAIMVGSSDGVVGN